MTPEYLDIDDAVTFLASLGYNTTRNALALRRSRGESPRYLKPTPKKVIYRKSDLVTFVDPLAGETA